MNVLRSVLMVVAASLPLGAWEAPTSGELAALMGQEPHFTMLESGQPLPPSAEAARQKRNFRFDLERRAMKLVLVYRTGLAKAERGRITAENNLACASMARRLGAPALFVRYLELLSSDELSSREKYAVNQAFRYLVQDVYGIDSLQIRLVSEAAALPPAQHMLFLLQLPLGGMFDMIPTQLPPREKVLPDIQLMTTVLRKVNNELKSVRDQRTADAAAQTLLPLLPLWCTTQQTRYHASAISGSLTPAENMAVQLLNSTLDYLIATRKALSEQKWYGSTRLQTIDELFR